MVSLDGVTILDPCVIICLWYLIVRLVGNWRFFWGFVCFHPVLTPPPSFPKSHTTKPNWHTFSHCHRAEEEELTAAAASSFFSMFRREKKISAAALVLDETASTCSQKVNLLMNSRYTTRYWNSLLLLAIEFREYDSLLKFMGTTCYWICWE